MRKVWVAIAALSCLTVYANANAQSVKSVSTAANGVEVTKNIDSFAERYEYSSPRTELRSANGALVSWVVAKVRAGKQQYPVSIQGFIIYFGEWRHFDYAVYRGGVPAKYRNTDKRVGSCRGACSLTESFTIDLSADDISKHAEGERLAIQIRSQGSDIVLLDIPVRYIDAVNEVSTGTP